MDSVRRHDERRPRASGSTASAAWGGWRCGPPGAGPTSQFVHINELKGDAATAAHLLSSTRSTAAGTATRAADGDDAASSTTRRSATAPRRAGRGAVGRPRRRHRARVLGQVPHARAARGRTSSGASRRSIVAAPVKDERAQHRRRRQRPPLRPARAPPADGRLLHDQLPRAGGQGDPRGHRHRARRRSRRSTT